MKLPVELSAQGEALGEGWSCCLLILNKCQKHKHMFFKCKEELVSQWHLFADKACDYKRSIVLRKGKRRQTKKAWREGLGWGYFSTNNTANRTR